MLAIATGVAPNPSPAKPEAMRGEKSADKYHHYADGENI